MIRAGKAFIGEDGALACSAKKFQRGRWRIKGGINAVLVGEKGKAVSPRGGAQILFDERRTARLSRLHWQQDRQRTIRMCAPGKPQAKPILNGSRQEIAVVRTTKDNLRFGSKIHRALQRNRFDKGAEMQPTFIKFKPASQPAGDGAINFLRRPKAGVVLASQNDFNGRIRFKRLR